MSSATPPTTLGKYQIIREIARSNDIVYEAYDPLMDRRVAVKELNVPAGSTPTQIQDRIDRFEREARAAGRLSHPNIMTVYDVDVDNGRHFMAMEYLDGHTLRNELDTKGSLDIERAVEIARAVLSGLSQAHEQGVIHRDIKPDNIQILSGGQIKITDFGIARLTFQPNLTMDGQVFGTPSYMSPEQVKGGDIDVRSDLFSVGVLLYEMVAGTKPFPGDSVIAITYAIMNTEPVQPRQASFGLWRVILKALDKSPMLRYSSALEMSQALAHIDDDSTGYSPYSTGSYPAPQFQLPSPTGGYAPVPQGNPYVDPNAPPNPYQQGYSQTNYQPYAPQTGAPYPDPYQPYSQGQNPPPVQPTYIPYPVYTRPRAKPLLSPEQMAGLKKFLAIVAVIGTFFALFIVLLNVFLPGR